MIAAAESDIVRAEVRELFAAGWRFTVRRSDLYGASVLGRSVEPRTAWAYFPGERARVVVEVLAELAT